MFLADLLILFNVMSRISAILYSDVNKFTQ